MSQFSTTDSLNLVITARDLSENMSRLSTKNDELLVFLYDFTDSVTLSVPILSEKFKLDENHLSREMVFARPTLVHKNLLFVLIEQDSETPIEQIDPIIRVKHREIRSAFNSRDYIEIEKYLGDEDILGIEIISDFEKQSISDFELKGIYKMDKYEYHIKIGSSKKK